MNKLKPSKKQAVKKYRKPRNKYSAVLYSTTKEPRGRDKHVYFKLWGAYRKDGRTRYKDVYVRVEIHECNYADVLYMHAKEKPGECILNGIPV